MRISYRRFIRQVSSLRYYLIPFLIIALLVLGGSSTQSPVALSIILFGSSVLSAIAILSWERQCSTDNLIWIFGLMIAVALAALLQLVPMPVWWLSALPMRADIYQDWNLLGIQENYTSISLMPERTFSALLGLLIPLSAILIVYRLGWSASTKYLPWALAIAGGSTALLGLAQIVLGDAAYLYENRVTSLPVGFFANINHQASFILMTIPYTAYLAQQVRKLHLSNDTYVARSICIGAIFLLQIIGVVGSVSVAGYAILVPVLLLSYILNVKKRRPRFNRQSYIMGAVIIFAILVAFTSPFMEGIVFTDITNKDGSRWSIYINSIDIWREHFLLGTGLGTFEPVYKLYEDPNNVSLIYINLAHNEYLQLAIELGLPGLVILVVAGGLCAKIVYRNWTASRLDETICLRQTSIVALLVPVMHSFVDYPVRTPSILFLCGICFAVVALGRRRSERDRITIAQHHRSAFL